MYRIHRHQFFFFVFTISKRRNFDLFAHCYIDLIMSYFLRFSPDDNITAMRIKMLRASM